MKKQSDLSRGRQILRQAARRYLELVEALMRERGPLIRGVFKLQGTRCGKPNCRCNHGHLHNTAVLTLAEGGTRRNVYLRATDRPDVKRRSAGYRKFRKSRAELVKCHVEITKAADRLLELLIMPYPPAARGRGQSSKKSRRHKRGESADKGNGKQ